MRQRKQILPSYCWLALLMLAISLYAVIASIEMGVWTDAQPGKGFMPMLSATILFSASLLLILRTLISHRKPGTSNTPISEPPATDGDKMANPRRDDETKPGRFLIAIIPNPRIRWALLMTIYVLATIKIIELLGMFFGLGVFVFTFLKFISKISWLKSALFTAVIIAVLYIVFSVLLNINVPRFLSGMGV